MIITAMNSLDIIFTGIVCWWCIIELFWIHPKIKIIKFNSLEQILSWNAVLWKLYVMKYVLICLSYTLVFNIVCIVFCCDRYFGNKPTLSQICEPRWTIINKNYCLVFNSELAWDGCLMKCYSQSHRLLDMEE